MSDQYKQRDLALLRHAALYRVLLPAVAWPTFFGGKQAGHVLKRLADLGLLLAFPRSLPGALSYYVLTPTGCQRINAPVDRAQPPQAGAMDWAIGLLTWCFLGLARRHLLTTAEVQKVVPGVQPSSIPYVITDERGTPCVLRMVQGAGGSPQQILRKLDDLAEKFAQNPELDRRLRSGELGFGVLAPTTQKSRALEAAVAASQVGRELTVIVDVGATAETLAALVKGRSA